MDELEAGLRVLANLCAAGADPHVSRVYVQTARDRLAGATAESLPALADELRRDMPVAVADSRPTALDRLVDEHIRRKREAAANTPDPLAPRRGGEQNPLASRDTRNRAREDVLRRLSGGAS